MKIETLVKLNLDDKKVASEVLAAINSNTDLALETCKQSGLTALHAASRDGNFKLVLAISIQLILKKQNLDSQDLEGNTALHLAFSNQQWHIVTFLLSQEANKDILNKQDIPACDKDVWRKNFFRREASSKVIAEPGTSENLLDYLNENYASGVSSSGVMNDPTVESKRNADVTTRDSLELHNVDIGGSPATNSGAGATGACEEDMMDFEEMSLTGSELSEASLETRLSMAKQLYSERNSYTGQAQQLLSGLNQSILNAYSALPTIQSAAASTFGGIKIIADFHS